MKVKNDWSKSITFSEFTLKDETDPSILMMTIHSHSGNEFNIPFSDPQDVDDIIASLKDKREAIWG